MFLQRLAILLYALLLAANVSHAKPLTHITFVTDWKAQAEHGGFYEALALGLYSDARARRAHRRRRTERERAADAGRRRRRFRHRLERLHPAQHRARRRADQSGDGDVPERPAGADRPSARRREATRRHEGQTDHDRRRFDCRVLAVAESEVRVFGLADPQIHLQPGAVPRRSKTRSRKAISPASPTRSNTRAHFKPLVFLLADNGYPGLREHGAGAAEMDRQQSRRGAAFVDATREGWIALSVKNAAPGQRAHPTRQSRDDDAISSRRRSTR